jgi:hypothetical protein
LVAALNVFANQPELKGKQMRDLFVRSTAAAIACVALVASLQAHAMSLGSAATMRSAANEASSVETVLCYGFGWRGWGWYPGWFRPACNGAYAAPAVVPAAPVYAEPAYPAPRRCWVQTDPDRNVGYWAAC